jgi:hypothetical protein
LFQRRDQVGARLSDTAVGQLHERLLSPDMFRSESATDTRTGSVKKLN